MNQYSEFETACTHRGNHIYIFFLHGRFLREHINKYEEISAKEEVDREKEECDGGSYEGYAQGGIRERLEGGRITSKT